LTRRKVRVELKSKRSDKNLVRQHQKGGKDSKDDLGGEVRGNPEIGSQKGGKLNNLLGNIRSSWINERRRKVMK